MIIRHCWERILFTRLNVWLHSPTYTSTTQSLDAFVNTLPFNPYLCEYFAGVWHPS